MDVREDDEDYKNPVDLMFDALEAVEPQHFAVRQYKKYKLAAGCARQQRIIMIKFIWKKTLVSIIHQFWILFR